MPTVSEIRQATLQYATGELDSNSFEEWLQEASRDGFVDQAALSLANRIEGLMAEASHAGWAESDLRDELAGTIQQVELNRVPA